MRKILLGLSFAVCHLTVVTAQTLEECQLAAEQNYPLIRQYDLISKATDLTVNNIQKGWLPQISAQAQATWQSDVMSWPERMKTVLAGMGVDIEGLRKDQYRIGIDINQTVYDGGAISSRKAIARQQGAVEEAQMGVTLYQIRRRVNEMYFSLLLIDMQLKLNADLQELLNNNEQKLLSMNRNGSAAECDYLSVKAERISVRQQGESLLSQRRMLAAMLTAFCGIEVKTPVKPTVTSTPQQTGLRPELKAIDAQLKLTDAQEQSLKSGLMPKLSIFAQGFYGYPGLNMFEDMISHKWSLNGMVGVSISWNVGALYSHRNDKTKLGVRRMMLDVERETFLFNNRLEQMRQNENICRYRTLMKDDEEIIALRSAVRKAAESKLNHGIIDVNDLMKEINAENNARVWQSIHEIEMLKEIYDLKYTTNN